MKALPLLHRIESKITITDDGCWEWTACRTKHGYGRVGTFKQANGRYKVGWAHRVVYELLVEPIPPGLTIDHLCRNRACVNPDHLEAVPFPVNAARGEGPAAKNARRTTCPQGHPYDRVTPGHGTRGPKRACVQCENKARRERYRVLKEQAAA